MNLLLSIILEVLVLLIVVPACTGGGVAVRQGGFFRGLLAVMVIGLVNLCLWFVIALLTAGLALVAQVLTFGLVGVLVNALAIQLTGRLMGDALHVRSFGAACGASLVMIIANLVIQHLLF